MIFNFQSIEVTIFNGQKQKTNTTGHSVSICSIEGLEFFGLKVKFCLYPTSFVPGDFCLWSLEPSRHPEFSVYQLVQSFHNAYVSYVVNLGRRKFWCRPLLLAYSISLLKCFSSNNLIDCFLLLATCKAPSGTMKARPQEGGCHIREANSFI